MENPQLVQEARTAFRCRHSQATAVELCSGLGGIGIGLRALGYHVARAYDLWEDAVRTYNHNFGGETATKCNLLAEKGRQLVAAERRRIGDIDLLAAGPPCQGFSKIRNGHARVTKNNRVLLAMPEYLAILIRAGIWAWLGLQAICIAIYVIGVVCAYGGIKRAMHELTEG